MVLKDMRVQENFDMDNPHRITFTPHRDIQCTCVRLFFTSIFIVCSLAVIAFVIYHFATFDHNLSSNATTAGALKPFGCNNGQDDDDNGDGIIGQHNATATTTGQAGHDGDVRLPRALKPLRYNISMVPHFSEGDFTFEGEVHIQVLALTDTDNITMHAHELNISRKNVAVRRALSNRSNRNNDTGIGSGTEKPAVSLTIRKQYLLKAKQFFVIEMQEKLTKGAVYEISIKFDGLLQDNLQGFYRSSYMAGSTKRWLASTQFQATDARRAFPCFDEPSLKAQFTLNIARPADMIAISNMPLRWSEKAVDQPTNYMWDHFDESLPMSTYLVAFAITDFSHLKVGNFAVWARAEAIHAANYALDVGPNILQFFQDYFSIEFPLPKMDLIALPDFQEGAMENWGLITFREANMLFEEGVSMATCKMRVATVISHELAHQWFGNLVTPSWWSDLWLNEGFASYMEYVAVDAIEPRWNAMDQFVVDELQNVFHLDALATSHQISVEVFNPDEITEIFDRISYSKGSTIIRMMSHFLTSKVFRRGLTQYLRKHAYKSADQDDLWNSLTAEAIAAGVLPSTATVKTIMDTWTLQVGFPILSVRRQPSSSTVQLQQERFTYMRNNNTMENASRWWIPITYTTDSALDFNDTRPMFWMAAHQASHEFTNASLSAAKWFVFNVQQTGFYRVNYDAANWLALTEHLMNETTFAQIATINRAQIVDDALNLARGGYLGYDVALNLTRYLAHERDFVPWKAAVDAFDFIDAMFSNRGDYDILKRYFLSLLSRVYANVVDETAADKANIPRLKLRSTILSMACRLGDNDCILRSMRYFQNWIQAPDPDRNNPISPNIRRFVYCTAIQYGTEDDWKFAFERYARSGVSSERELLLSALGCSREPSILTRYLQWAIDGHNIRKQDVYRVFATVSRNKVGQPLAFDFVRLNWMKIKTYMGSSMTSLHIILKLVTRRMNNKYWLKQLKSFVHDELHGSGRTIRQAIEQVEVNIHWMNHSGESIVNWLQQKSNN